MRIVKIAGAVLAVIVALVVIGPAFVGDSFAVEKSIVVEASASEVYDLIAELRAWEKWNYWANNDDTMKLEYGEVTSGPGASYTWAGADGAGTATILAAEQNKSVDLTLDFGERGQGNVAWSLAEADGKTEVTWVFSGDAQSYLGR
ncbi:SRPBCC family protein, partial [Candidatus Poribacteria bacterium]|nr:SRPBCC family protein [Candidatus Poribacteria bacterium]